MLVPPEKSALETFAARRPRIMPSVVLVMFRVPPVTRIQARAVWDLLLFILNGVIFILIGLQLGAIRDAGLIEDVRALIIQGAVVSAAAILVRLIWVPLATLIPRWLSRALRRRDPTPPPGHVFLVSWTGMRGVVTLAAAAGIPLLTLSGEAFPGRDIIQFVAFAVTIAPRRPCHRRSFPRSAWECRPRRSASSSNPNHQSVVTETKASIFA